MKIVAPEYEILSPLEPEAMLARIERAGRTCYRSENRITKDSAAAFVRSIIKSGHHSVIEHESISVRLVCDRGVTHELVRHRLASFSQESTRYVNYGRGPEGRGLVLIKPLFFEEGSEKYDLWLKAMEAAEKAYLDLTAAGATAQEARTVLPNSLKTEIVMTANLRQWRHVLSLRCAPASHPQMREIMNMLLAGFKEILPEIFGDI
ncbi:FAD-dependent thymidylate synthase [Deltaproteobacteria bacterium OttesenSCG-928-K17]|nr:FAD-dependent thymidylate synthase [Deltaproteobacteria bacterium OttesenSCG-928-K17]